jgi:hypothetical protein
MCGPPADGSACLVDHPLREPASGGRPFRSVGVAPGRWSVTSGRHAPWISALRPLHGRLGDLLRLVQGVKCPEPAITSRRASGISSAISADSSGGVSWSLSPTSTSVGQPMAPSPALGAPRRRGARGGSAGGAAGRRLRRDGRCGPARSGPGAAGSVRACRGGAGVQQGQPRHPVVGLADDLDGARHGCRHRWSRRNARTCSAKASGTRSIAMCC